MKIQESLSVGVRTWSGRWGSLIAVSLLLAASAASAAPISLTGGTYMQDFNSLVSSGSSSVVPAGWAFHEVGTSSFVDGQYAAGTGSSGTGNTYSFGSTGSSDRAFGSVLSGTFTDSIIGAQFVNNTGGTITELAINYTGEMWRAGFSSRFAQDRLDFAYSTTASAVNTGSYTNFNALDYNSSNINATAGPLDGNLAANRTVLNATITGLNIANGSTFWVRWSEFDISNADDGLAIDDFSLTPTFTLPPPDPMLNEFVANHVGTDTMEFVEVIGAVNTNYSAFTILQIEGDSGGGIGTIDSIFTLGTTDLNGIFATALQSNELENGSMTLLLVENFTGTLGSDVDTNDDGNFDSTPWSRIVDSVAVSDGGAGAVFYALTVLVPGFDGNSNPVGGASRLPDGTGAWVRNAFDPASPQPGNAQNTHGALNQLATITQPPASAVPEPACLSLIALGAVSLLHRRQRAA